MTPTSADPRDDDLIFGASAIAEWLRIPRHTVYYWARKKLAPITRVGKTLVMSKRRFRREVAKD